MADVTRTALPAIIAVLAFASSAPARVLPVRPVPYGVTALPITDGGRFAVFYEGGGRYVAVDTPAGRAYRWRRPRSCQTMVSAVAGDVAAFTCPTYGRACSRCGPGDGSARLRSSACSVRISATTRATASSSSGSSAATGRSST